mgnify:CR=1 FL=1
MWGKEKLIGYSLIEADKLLAIKSIKNYSPVPHNSLSPGKFSM